MSSAKSAQGFDVTNTEPLFHNMSRAIIWGMQSRAVQVFTKAIFTTSLFLRNKSYLEKMFLSSQDKFLEI